jgi:hypothetical protein
MVIRVGGLVAHSGLGWAGRSIGCSCCVFRGSVGVLGPVRLVAGRGAVLSEQLRLAYAIYKHTTHTHTHIYIHIYTHTI